MTDNSKQIMFTNRDISKLMNDIFTTYNEEIVFSDGTKSTYKDYLNTKFYAFKEDIVNYGSFSEFDVGYNLESLLSQDKQKSFALVEQTNRDITFASNLTLESVSGRITIIIQDDKQNVLDAFINKIREGLRGKYDTYLGLDNKQYRMYVSFSSLISNGDTFDSPLGRSSILQLEFKIGYIDKAEIFTDEKYVLRYFDSDENSAESREIDLSKSTIVDEDFTTVDKKNTNMNYNGIIGCDIVNATLTFTFTSYLFNEKFDNTGINDNKKYSLIDLRDMTRQIVYGNRNLNMYFELLLFDEEEPLRPKYRWQCHLNSFSSHKVNNDWTTVTFTLTLAVDEF
jgi:hypothetical protein